MIASNRITATVEFPSYNSRRYSRPWVARIGKWVVGSRPEMVFGSFLGNDQAGGICEIPAQAGDVIRYGQKDNRGGAGSSEWAVVLTDGKFVEVTEGTAAKCFRADPDATSAIVDQLGAMQAERIASLQAVEALKDQWRADNSNRVAYNEALRLEQAAKGPFSI